MCTEVGAFRWKKFYGGSAHFLYGLSVFVSPVWTPSNNIEPGMRNTVTITWVMVSILPIGLPRDPNIVYYQCDKIKIRQGKKSPTRSGGLLDMLFYFLNRHDGWHKCNIHAANHESVQRLTLRSSAFISLGTGTTRELFPRPYRKVSRHTATLLALRITC